MHVGGRVEWLLEPADPEQLVQAVVAAREAGLCVRILGGGANVIVDDGLLEGAVISTARLNKVFRPAPEHTGLEPGAASAQVAPQPRETNTRLVAWCGASLPALVAQAKDLGWSGLEGLIGVPGQLGGGVAMNAGGRWGDLWQTIERVRTIDLDGRLYDDERAACHPGYRDGGIGQRVVVSAVLRLKPDDPNHVRQRCRAYLQHKNRVQPVSQWSAGCIFKNPDPELSGGLSAGQLIERHGLKGRRRGDAEVSPQHGNFIVNLGNARATDVLGLIDEVRDVIAQRTGIALAGEAKVWRAGR